MTWIKDFPMVKDKIFVFGSNIAGRHGAGAARDALLHYGAVYGVGEGHHGNSYAIPTKDDKIQTLPLDKIKVFVENFKTYARLNLDKQFFLTAIGCGLAGYKPDQIAPMFEDAPDNVEQPKEFITVYNKKWSVLDGIIE